MTPARKPEPSLADMFQRMLDRDEAAQATQSHLAAKVSDLSTVTQSMQLEIQRLVKLAERQDGYNERQITLAEKTAEHAKTFERAFGEIEKHKHTLGESIDKLAQSLGSVSKIVTAHQTGIKVSWALFGVIAALLVAVAEIRFRRVDERLQEHIQVGADIRQSIERRLDRADVEIDQLKTTRQAR